MVPGTEVAGGFQWLSSVLLGDSTLVAAAPGGIWRGMAPPETGTSTPYVIVSLQAGTDVLTANAFRVYMNGLYQIKAVGPADAYASIVTAAGRIDALLGRTIGSISGGTILFCHRELPLAVDELVAGELWSNLGGLYRIAIQGA
jgi:hypothetical protein